MGTHDHTGRQPGLAPGIPGDLATALVRQLPDYFTVVDRAGTILTYSRRVPGRSQLDFSGRNIADFSSDEHTRARLLDAIAEARASGQVVQFEGSASQEAVEGSNWFIVRAVPLDLPGWEDSVVVVSTELTLQRELWREHQRQGERIARLFDHTSLLAVSVDREMRITQWNPAASKVFGYSEAEVLGRHAWEFLYEPGLAEIYRETFLAAMEDSSLLTDQRCIHRNKRGQQVVCDWFSLPLIGANGDTLGLTSLGQDLTQALQAEQALREARRMAEQNARAKSRFLARMSHELRTPLHGILGALELLADQDAALGARPELDIIRASSQTLLKVVNDVLDFAKAESGGLSLHLEPMDLPRLLREVHELMRPLAEQKALRLGLEMAPELPATILGDVDRLRQILVNLLSNAIKFTERGGAILRAAADGQEVQIEVVDSGIGIAEEDQPLLYREFFQVEGSHMRQTGGTGLGLSISRHLAELMGGSLQLRSQPGAGSTFTLRFPTTRSEAEIPGQRASPERDYRRRVLLVDDNSVNLAVGSRMLLRLGVEVATAQQGADAVSRAVAEHFDLILMDLHMPVMDGIDATRTLRSLGGRLAELPIVAITANVQAEDRNACLEAGMNAVLLKPVLGHQLVELLDAFFLA